MAAIKSLLSSTPYPKPLVSERGPTHSAKPLAPTGLSSPCLTTPRQTSLPPPSNPSPQSLPESPSPVTARVPDAKAQCPLERLSLQPVGMSAHYLDRCYCYLCKCGQHVCPGDLKKTRTLPKGWKSHYQETYQSNKDYKPVIEMKPVIQYSLPRPTKMDLKTTKQIHFQDPKSPPIVLPRRKYTPNNIKLVSSSSYQRDFPNWKPGETVLFKPMELPYRGDLVTFKCKSTYQDEFIAERPKEHFALKNGRKRSDPIAVLNDFYGTSSSRTQYKPPSGGFEDYANQSRKMNQRNISEMTHTPAIRSLTTTYREQYDQKEQSPQPLLKRQAHRSASLGI